MTHIILKWFLWSFLTSTSTHLWQWLPFVPEILEGLEAFKGLQSSCEEWLRLVMNSKRSYWSVASFLPLAQTNVIQLKEERKLWTLWTGVAIANWLSFWAQNEIAYIFFVKIVLRNNIEKNNIYHQYSICDNVFVIIWAEKQNWNIKIFSMVFSDVKFSQ